MYVNHLQKPFWESGDEIDVAMYSEALVTIFRFLPNEESLPLFTTCLEPERPESVKICAVKACLTLSLEVCHFSVLMKGHRVSRNLPVVSTTLAEKLNVPGRDRCTTFTEHF